MATEVREKRRFLVTGGAGFIGSALCRKLVREGHFVLCVDKLTYAGNLSSLRDVSQAPNYRFLRADICDDVMLSEAMRLHDIDAIIHLAAESHVDRSIDGPEAFVQTNVVGTFRLLSAALSYWQTMEQTRRHKFRFHHVSTDEVYGDLPLGNGKFTEQTGYAPSSPYSASKAASDHFVRAWHQTYGLPVVLSNCSNNYGPYQFPEKLIPLILLNAIEGRPLPVYGNGQNVRDWLYVDDHVSALAAILLSGQIGESYNIGGRSERTNMDVVLAICEVLDARRPMGGGRSYRELITYIPDRPGHDRRYAIDPSKAERELGWTAAETFESGLSKTIDWYLESEWWWRPIREVKYSGERIGTNQGEFRALARDGYKRSGRLRTRRA